MFKKLSIVKVYHRGLRIFFAKNCFLIYLFLWGGGGVTGPRKTKLKEPAAVRGRNRDIRSLMVSNHHLPQTEEIPPKVVILDE